MKLLFRHQQRYSHALMYVLFRLTHIHGEPPILADDKTPRVETAYQQIRQKILRNEMAPGLMVLEEQLARTLGMSRTPLREALVRLAHEDLIEIIPRRGMRVKPVTLRDMREIDEVLACLEVQAAERLASRRLTDEERAALQSAIDGMDAALEAEDMEAWAESDFRFHTLLFELCGNAHLMRTAKLFLDKAHRARLATLPFRKTPVYSNSNHAAVVEAIKRGDAETAREIHLAHKRRWSRELNEIANTYPILPSVDPET